MEPHDNRAEKAADALRGILLTLATGGIVAAYTMRSDVSSKTYWLWATSLSILALGTTLRSWFLVKARALDRQANTAEARARLPNRNKWYPRASWLRDTMAAWLLIAGAAVLAIGLA